MKVVTISREYGAGGHSVGRAVAKLLGVEFFDQDIIKQTALVSGLDIEMIRQEEELISRKHNILDAISPISYDQKNTIYEIERDVILKLVADKGPCVILGRCADHILTEAGIDCLKVFIYADDVHRAMRVSELIGSNDANKIQREMKKTDTARHNYYARFTGKRWADCHNYNLVLDSGLFGYEECAELIAQAAQD